MRGTSIKVKYLGKIYNKWGMSNLVVIGKIFP